ncbi:hypothetical protein GN958_ATG03057, partial [Phytophthora infestans]
VVDLVLSRFTDGEKKAAIARTSPVHLRTLCRLIKRSSGISYSYSGPSRPGPKTVMPVELGRDLVKWISALQRCGMPVGRNNIIAKVSACIARVRKAVEMESVSVLFYTLAKLFIEMKFISKLLLEPQKASVLKRFGAKVDIFREECGAPSKNRGAHCGQSTYWSRDTAWLFTCLSKFYKMDLF